MEKWIISDWDPLKGSKVYFVNLRPQPNKDGAPLGEVTAGTVVEKLGESGEWSQVRMPLKTDSFIGTVEGWVITRLLKGFSEPAEPAEFTIDTDLKAVRSRLTAEQIDDYFRSKNPQMPEVGRFVIEAAERENVNATFICALAIHESDFGRSKISEEKFNLFGWGAVDSSPGASAMNFDSYEHCIRHVVQRINKQYLTPDGDFFVGRPCLGSHAQGYGMNVRYTPTDSLWGTKVAALARAIESLAAGRPRPEPEPREPGPTPTPRPTTRPVGDLIAAINRVNPAQRYYEARDITGDRLAETFCNWFAADVLALLNVFLPLYRDADRAGHYPTPHPIYGKEVRNKPWSAHLLNRYFKEGGGGKWHKVTRREAVVEANRGGNVVASIPSISGRSGHIAIVRPDSAGTAVRVAQAGKRSGPNMTIEEGFGALTGIAEFYKYGA